MPQNGTSHGIPSHNNLRKRNRRRTWERVLISLFLLLSKRDNETATLSNQQIIAALQSSVGFRGHFALYFLTSLSISWLDWKTFQIRGWQLVQSGLPRLHYQLRERGFPSGVGDFAILRLRNGVKSILKEHLTKRSALVNEISFWIWLLWQNFNRTRRPIQIEYLAI